MASVVTREQVYRHQVRTLADRLFDLEAENVLLQQEVTLRDQRIAELEAAALANGGLVEPRKDAEV